MPSQNLKERYDELPVDIPETQRTRIHRAIRWFDRSQQESNDDDAKFIFLWISFNAAYARLFGDEATERDNQRKFFSVLIEIDTEGLIYDLLYQEFSGTIRNLINNKYLYEPFWKALRDHDSSDRWRSSFTASCGLALKKLVQKDTLATLEIIFDRIYALRNQIIHGGATWNSRLNREQVRNGTDLMNKLVPVMIHLMLKDPNRDFGEVIYPVVVSS